MIRRAICGLLLCSISAFCAAELTKEIPFSSAGQGISVSVSTSAWTKLTSSVSALSGRSGLTISNPSSNSASVFIVIDSATPTEAISVGPKILYPGQDIWIAIDENLNAYGVSKHTSAETVHVQELKQ